VPQSTPYIFSNFNENSTFLDRFFGKILKHQIS
jgi:hypothetical protein